MLAIRSYFHNCAWFLATPVYFSCCVHWYRDTSDGLLAVLPCRRLLPSRRSPLKNLWEKPQAFLLKALISQTPFKPWAAKHFVYCVYGPLTLLMLLVFFFKNHSMPGTNIENELFGTIAVEKTTLEMLEEKRF